MTDEIVRKFVKPAHPGACIPDSAHGRDLPQDGLEVLWDHYWIGREMTGDVIVSDAAPATAPAAKQKVAEIAKPLAV